MQQGDIELSVLRRLFNVILVILIIGSLMTAYVYKMARQRYNYQQTIFTMEDTKGDDYGPGTYIYPFDSVFDPKNGLFDLTNFTFSALRNNYCFDMTFPLVTNPWGASEGFSHTIIEIYINDGTDNGKIEPLIEGANIVFDPKDPWNYLLKVVSFNNTAVYWASDYVGASGKTEGIQVKLMADKRTIRVTVPKILLPGDPKTWKYCVLVGSMDGAGPDNFRVVNASTSQWNFGGGTDTDYDPNVIDMLALPGEQKTMLGSYDFSKKVQAIVKPVGPAPLKNERWNNFLDKAIALFQRMNWKL